MLGGVFTEDVSALSPNAEVALPLDCGSGCGGCLLDRRKNRLQLVLAALANRAKKRNQKVGLFLSKHL
jgi:hypothetical protein